MAVRYQRKNNIHNNVKFSHWRIKVDKQTIRARWTTGRKFSLNSQWSWRWCFHLKQAIECDLINLKANWTEQRIDFVSSPCTEHNITEHGILCLLWIQRRKLIFSSALLSFNVRFKKYCWAWKMFFFVKSFVLNCLNIFFLLIFCSNFFLFVDSTEPVHFCMFCEKCREFQGHINR